jgi:hypothetical protein
MRCVLIVSLRVYLQDGPNHLCVAKLIWLGMRQDTHFRVTIRQRLKQGSFLRTTRISDRLPSSYYTAWVLSI